METHTQKNAMTWLPGLASKQISTPVAELAQHREFFFLHDW
jgi:hypothetical protein